MPPCSSKTPSHRPRRPAARRPIRCHRRVHGRHHQPGLPALSLRFGPGEARPRASSAWSSPAPGPMPRSRCSISNCRNGGFATWSMTRASGTAPCRASASCRASWTSQSRAVMSDLALAFLLRLRRGAARSCAPIASLAYSPCAAAGASLPTRRCYVDNFVLMTAQPSMWHQTTAVSSLQVGWSQWSSSAFGLHFMINFAVLRRRGLRPGSRRAAVDVRHLAARCLARAVQREDAVRPRPQPLGRDDRLCRAMRARHRYRQHLMNPLLKSYAAPMKSATPSRSISYPPRQTLNA